MLAIEGVGAAAAGKTAGVSTTRQADLARANNPNHVALGWVDRCNRCHLPRTWNQAEIHQ